MNITAKVRKRIPTILKKENKRMTFNEIFDELLKYKDLECDLKNEDGEYRLGVLRGVINSHIDGSIPVENMKTYKESNNRYFIYMESKFNQKLDVYYKNITTFVKNMEKNELSTEEVINLSEKDKDIYFEIWEKTYDLKKTIDNALKEGKTIDEY